MRGHQFEIEGVRVVPVDRAFAKAPANHLQRRVVGVHVEQQGFYLRLAQAPDQFLRERGFATPAAANDADEQCFFRHGATPKRFGFNSRAGRVALRSLSGLQRPSSGLLRNGTLQSAVSCGLQADLMTAFCAQGHGAADEYADCGDRPELSAVGGAAAGDQVDEKAERRGEDHLGEGLRLAFEGKDAGAVRFRRIGIEAADDQRAPDTLHQIEDEKQRDDRRVEFEDKQGQHDEIGQGHDPPQKAAGRIFATAAHAQAMRLAARPGRTEVEEEVDDADQQGAALVFSDCQQQRQAQDHGLDHRLDVVLDHVEEAFEAHRFGHQPAQTGNLHRVAQGLPHVHEDLLDARLLLGPAVEFLGIGAQRNKADAIGDERGEKQSVQVAGEIGDGRGDGDGDRRADFRPGTGVAVDLGFFIHPVVQAQPGEDHRFVRALTERFADAEKEHSDKEVNQLVRQQAETEEGDHVGEVGDEHAAATAIEVGDRPGRDVGGVDAEFAKADEKAHRGKRVAAAEQKQHHERLEITLVFQEAVKGETENHAWRSFGEVGRSIKPKNFTAKAQRREDRKENSLLLRGFRCF